MKRAFSNIATSSGSVTGGVRETTDYKVRRLAKNPRRLMPNPAGTHLVSFLRLMAVSLLVALPANYALGSFHLWNIREIYTDASGSLQFIEMDTTATGENLVGGQQILVRNVGASMSHVFTLPPGNLPGDTQNRSLLFGTAGLQAAGGPAPDYIIPDGFLFLGGGSITFFGENSGPYAALPTDGNLSRVWGGGNAANTPRNYAGQTGTVVPSQADLLYHLSLSTIDGGGAAAAGGGFALNGTIGQPDAGAPTSGGVFTVTGGFWPGIGTTPAPRPALSIRRGVPVGGVNTVILSWPNPSTGYVLQQTANMSAPGGGWTDVAQPPVVNGANREVTLQATGQICLFRLRRL